MLLNIADITLKRRDFAFKLTAEQSNYNLLISSCIYDINAKKNSKTRPYVM